MIRAIAVKDFFLVIYTGEITFYTMMRELALLIVACLALLGVYFYRMIPKNDWESWADDISITIEATPGKKIEEFAADVIARPDNRPFKISLQLYENRIPIRVTLRYRGREWVKTYDPSDNVINDKLTIGDSKVEPVVIVMIRIKHTWGMQY